MKQIYDLHLGRNYSFNKTLDNGLFQEPSDSVIGIDTCLPTKDCKCKVKFCESDNIFHATNHNKNM